MLNKIGITAIFHNERTYLVEADSFRIPPTCTVLVDTPVDKETGLLFVDVKPVEAAKVNALQTASPEKKQEVKIKNEVARAKKINANRRESQEDRLEALNSEAGLRQVGKIELCGTEETNQPGKSSQQKVRGRHSVVSPEVWALTLARHLNGLCQRC